MSGATVKAIGRVLAFPFTRREPALPNPFEQAMLSAEARSIALRSCGEALMPLSHTERHSVIRDLCEAYEHECAQIRPAHKFEE